jgi:hypothetical protein
MGYGWGPWRGFDEPLQQQFFSLVCAFYNISESGYDIYDYGHGPADTSVCHDGQ